MTRSSSGRKWLLVTLGVLIVAGPIVESALAMRRKPRMTALVDGKRFKAQKRAVIFTYTTTGFSVIGQTRVKRGVSRAISVNCGSIDLQTTPVPSAPIPCLGIYQETIVRRGGGLRNWTSNGTELTIESFDGARVTGTFRGVITPSVTNPEEPPVTIEQGSFSAAFRDFGI